MSSHSNHSAWRQKWVKVVNGALTEKNYHTWHATEDDAFLFVINYAKAVDKNKDHFHSCGYPGKHENLLDEPFGKFLETKVPITAPLS